ncbi:hypothetical protein L210DRAFT_3549560, partial [Boletus edulis BED1]
MIHSSSEATSNSPTPISPFSTYSRLSEATSDVHIRGYLSPRTILVSNHRSTRSRRVQHGLSRAPTI